MKNIFLILSLISLYSCGSVAPGNPGSEKIAILYAPDTELFQKVSAELISKGCQQSNSVYGAPVLGMFGALNKKKQVLTTIRALRNEALKSSTNVLITSLVLEYSGKAAGLTYFCKPEVAQYYLRNNPYKAPWL